MKKTILSILIVAAFAACNSSIPEDKVAELQPVTSGSDTAGLSEFQNWKGEQEPIVAMDGIPTEVANEAAQASKVAKPATKIIYRDKPVKSTVKYKAPVKTYSEPDYTYTPPVATGGREAVSRNDGAVTGAGESGVGTGAGNGTGEATPPVATEKKGWSKAAKGTAIGAASGAVLGAIISKKKGTGAIIGGVVGAAGGYVLGRAKDKKDGRYFTSN